MILLSFLGLLLLGLVTGLASPFVTIDADDVALGLTLLVFWSSGFLFLVLCTGLLMVGILGLVVFLMLNFLFYTNFGLVRGWFLRRPILGIFGQGVQFQCRLFLLVQALIFGAPVVLLVL